MRWSIQTQDQVVAIEGEHIAPNDGAFDLVINLPGALVAPGLINAHDHLHRNHYGRLGEPPYANAYDWANDIQVRAATRIHQGRARPRRQALLDGAWKNLFCGVTAVVHHDRWEPDFEDGFPLRVARLASADSLGMTPDIAAHAPDGRPFALHMAEGVDARAAGEIDVLNNLGFLGPDLIAVHGVGMDDAAIARFRASGAALVWCPTSNRFLFGRTAPAALLAKGVDVLLGSDSRLTGDGDLLDEIRYARELGLLSDERLRDAVGQVAARRLGLPEPSLDVGADADLLVVSKPVLQACAEDVLLVIVGGVPRVAHPALAPRLAAFACFAKQRTVGAVVRWTSLAAPEGRLLQ